MKPVLLLAALTAALAGEELVLGVTDPLAAANACACVAGYAQRDYPALGAFLQQRLGRPVRVVCGSGLDAVQVKAGGAVHALIGKRAALLGQGAAWGLVGLAALTDRAGLTTTTGLIVVRGGGARRDLAGLDGARILLGPAAAPEKDAALVPLLTAAGVALPDPPARSSTCAAAVQALLAGRADAVAISAHSQPLLEGCGSVQPGELRVIAETAPVPFVVAYATASLPEAERAALRAALLAVAGDAGLLVKLESRDGFTALPQEGSGVGKDHSAP